MSIVKIILFVLSELFEFIKHIGIYGYTRVRQLIVFGSAAGTLIVIIFDGVKEGIVRRTFWGRSNFYKTLFHLAIGVVTLLVGLGGIVGKLNFLGDNSSTTVFASEGLGYTDILGQSNVTRTIVPDNPILNNAVDRVIYVVKGGDTLSTIAQRHNISIDTIKWANDLSDDNIHPGQELTIFRHSGVLHVVADGDTLDSIATEYSSGDQIVSSQVIAEVNWLEPPFVLTPGMELFVPDGIIAPPPIVIAVNPTTPVAAPQPIVQPSPSGSGATGTFIRPVDFGCGSVSQWYGGYHQGIDISSFGSAACPIYATDGGVVTEARWTTGGGGFCVAIDHGNGFSSGYCHGNGEIFVLEGQVISQGQHIMNMGSSGWATGVHLHFYMFLNGVNINPAGYVPI